MFDNYAAARDYVINCYDDNKQERIAFNLGDEHCIEDDYFYSFNSTCKPWSRDDEEKDEEDGYKIIDLIMNIRKYNED